MSGMATKKEGQTPRDILEELVSMGGRLLMTIPFGSSVDDMQGFMSIVGEGEGEGSIPTLTFCVSKPKGGAIISTIVYPSSDSYLDFADRMYVDAYTKFSREGSKDN
jgi:hypothetical protein